MKKFFQLALLLLAVGFLAGCGSEAASTESDNDSETTETTNEATGEEAVDMSGPEYTSAYVCPMHCAGSGSAEPGTCPSCGMEYVVNDSAPADAVPTDDGHDHDNHEGHNH